MNHRYGRLHDRRQDSRRQVRNTQRPYRGNESAVKRAILSFRRDTQGDWMADLDCGHRQHVRHRPPFVNRPWVECETTRTKMVGTELDCVRCDRMEWPEGLVAYRRTGEFDETTIPPGFAREHSTRPGAWARIHVVSGALKYHVGAPVKRSFPVEAPKSAVIVPGVPHRIEDLGPVRFFVEFWRAQREP